jgi:hypothetical protein
MRDLEQLSSYGRKKQDFMEAEKYLQAFRYLITIFSSRVIVTQSVEHIQDPAQPKGDTKTRQNAKL